MDNRTSKAFKDFAIACTRLGASVEGVANAIEKLGWIVKPPKKKWWEFWK